MKILKIFTTVLTSIILVAVAYKVIEACSFGEWDDCDLANYSFFNPKIIDQPQVTPFFVTCHSLYDSNDDYRAMDKINAREWSMYLNNKLDSNDVLSILSMQTVMLDSVYNFYYKINPIPPKTEWVNKIAVKMPGIEKAVVDYLKFSKGIERVMWGNSIWDYQDKGLDTILYVSSIDDAKSEMKNSKSAFLKIRYAFQVQRILFYLNRYDECAKWYTDNLRPLKPAGSIAFRSLAYYAGCLYHQRHYDQSNYLFSLIYDQFPVMKEAAFTSFHPWEDADWSGTLSMAKTTHEKEVLWQLFGVYADPLKGMKEIYAINPKSEMIDLLLTRAINICEREQLTNSNYENEYGNEDDGETNTDTASVRRVFDSSNSFDAFNTADAVNELSAFIKNVAYKNNTHNPCLWLNAFAYLNWMNKKYEVADSSLIQLKNCKDISDLNKSQLAITDLLVQFGKMKELTPQTEQQLYELLLRMEVKYTNDISGNVYAYIMDQLAARYSAMGKLVMAELSSNSGRSYYTEENQYDEMLAFMRKATHTNFEFFLLDHYRIKASNIIEYKAVQELKQNHIDAAIKWFEQDTSSGNAELYGNPFTIHITDCHDCDHNAPQKAKYTKYAFALKLKELLSNAEATRNKDEKALNYFLLANGLYNLTYYGNARMVTEYFPFQYMDWNSYESHDEYTSGGCEIASDYYAKALECATKKEFKAKCAWMCAKCELNNWYSTKEYKDGSHVFPDGEYYKMMKEKFSDTKYYSEVINECGYFCSYTGGGNECIRNKE